MPCNTNTSSLIVLLSNNFSKTRISNAIISFGFASHYFCHIIILSRRSWLNSSSIRNDKWNSLETNRTSVNHKMNGKIRLVYTVQHRELCLVSCESCHIGCEQTDLTEHPPPQTAEGYEDNSDTRRKLVIVRGTPYDENSLWQISVYEILL